MEKKALHRRRAEFIAPHFPTPHKGRGSLLAQTLAAAAAAAAAEVGPQRPLT